MDTTQSLSRTHAALAGLVSAVVALASGELLAGLVRGIASPLEAVAERFIDFTPGALERWAIRTFGENDKLVLVAGAVVMALVLGAVFGLLARRDIRIGYAGIAGFGLLGFVATATGPDGAFGALSSVLALPVGIGSLWLLFGRGRDVDPESPSTAMPLNGISRRTLMRDTGILAGLGVAMAAGGRSLAQRFKIDLSTLSLPSVRRPSPPIPTDVSLGVEGIAEFITPADEFYRVDTALTVPEVDPNTWRLRVTGMVDRELEFTYQDLLDMELVERDITLTCVSNPVGGDLLGNARWTGIPLSVFLDRAGVSADADQVVGRSVDEWTCGFPVTEAYDKEAFLVLGMNGEVLPKDRGFPARLLVPGLYGYVSATKWLTEIELTRFDLFDQYWVPRGWDPQGPIKTMARIDTPKPLAKVAAGTVAVGGVAWAQTRGIDKVEVRVDDGPWEEAELAAALNTTTWRQWVYRWDATPGRHRITVRATDATGEVQTEERADPFPNGASGWQQLFVSVDA